MTNDTIPLITALLAFIVSVVGLPALLARIRTIEAADRETTTKVNFLWDIYAVDAIKAARENGLSVANSPVKMLPLWQKVIPVETLNKLESDLAILRKECPTEDPVIVALELSTRNQDDLLEIPQKTSIKAAAVIGGVIDFVQAEIDKEKDQGTAQQGTDNSPV